MCLKATSVLSSKLAFKVSYAMRFPTTLLFCPFVLHAGITVTVSNDDELRKALAGIKEETVLKIEPGDYRGGWSVRGVTDLTVEGANPKDPPHFKGGNTAWHFSKCPGLTLRHLKVSGQKHNGINIDDGGDLKNPVTQVSVSNLSICNIGPRGNFDALKCSGVDNLQISNCEFSGWGGQAIDFVGCHKALISHCHFSGKPGYSQTTGPQFKGGSSDIIIEHCVMERAGMRPVQAGGSTGMAYFRPPGAKYEARNITIRNNIFIGGMCAVTFTGVDGAEFTRNTVINPDKWVLRILQETTAPGFPPCRKVNFHHNIIVFERAKVRGVVNIGAKTAPETFRFHHNLWFASDSPARSKPRLPVKETDSIYGVDPRLDAKTHRPKDPKALSLLTGK